MFLPRGHLALCSPWCKNNRVQLLPTVDYGGPARDLRLASGPFSALIDCVFRAIPAA